MCNEKCEICKVINEAIPKGKPGITLRETALALQGASIGLFLSNSEALHVLAHHNWLQLPHPISERNDSARYAKK